MSKLHKSALTVASLTFMGLNGCGGPDLGPDLQDATVAQARGVR